MICETFRRPTMTHFCRERINCGDVAWYVLYSSSLGNQSSSSTSSTTSSPSPSSSGCIHVQHDQPSRLSSFWAEWAQLHRWAQERAGKFELIFLRTWSSEFFKCQMWRGSLFVHVSKFLFLLFQSSSSSGFKLYVPSWFFRILSHTFWFPHFYMILFYAPLCP